MTAKQETTSIMAERLKQLRESKHLSHERLSQAITEKYEEYGVSISRDSLINYEKANSKNLGMRAECLRCLADFYGVSTDYLLGLSKVQTPSTDLQAVVDYTGLSEDNAATLHTHKIAASFDPPLIYNESRNIRGDELFLDCANDLLDALYENRDILLANYYLTKALAASITQCDPAYYDEARERELLSHGYTMMLTVKAVQLSCTEFGDVLGRYLRSKYVDAYYNERTAPTQEGD